MLNRYDRLGRQAASCQDGKIVSKQMYMCMFVVYTVNGCGGCCIYILAMCWYI